MIKKENRMSKLTALKARCFFGAATSALVALIAQILKISKVVTDVDGWTFWSVGMGLWFILMVLGFAIRKDK
jgi:hypothetical protein